MAPFYGSPVNRLDSPSGGGDTDVARRGVHVHGGEREPDPPGPEPVKPEVGVNEAAL